jgi:glycerol uptake facilitator-like aquaporin
MFKREKTAMLVAEFFGTFLLASAVLGTTTFLAQGIAIQKYGIPFFGPATAGLTLALLVLIIGKVSGAHVNPAVTFGLWSARKISTVQAVLYIAVQMLAGAAALLFAGYMFGQELPSISNGNSVDWRIFIAEATGTFIFTAGIAAAVEQKFEDGKLAFAIGISLFAGATVASMASNGILNPALAVGFNSVNINYIVAPLVGGFLGVNAYNLVFAEKKTAKTNILETELNSKTKSKKSTTAKNNNTKKSKK